MLSCTVTLLSLAVTYCYLLSLTAIYCRLLALTVTGATAVDVLWGGVPLLVMAGSLSGGEAGGGDASGGQVGGIGRGGGGSDERVGGRRTGNACVAGSGGTRCAGTIFQRNAISLVAAAGQPHAQAHSWAAYESQGLSGHRRRATQRELRRRAEEARHWAAAFDSRTWAANFVRGMRAAWETHSVGAVMHVSVVGVFSTRARARLRGAAEVSIGFGNRSLYRL